MIYFYYFRNLIMLSILILLIILYFIISLLCFPFIKIEKVQDFLVDLWEKIKDTMSL